MEYDRLLGKNLNALNKVFANLLEKVRYLSASVWSPSLKKYIAYGRFSKAADWLNKKNIFVENANGEKSACSVVDLAQDLILFQRFQVMEWIIGQKVQVLFK